MKFHPILLFLLLTSGNFSQTNEVRFKLPRELNEISGLEKFNDSLLVAINDSGNEPYIYFINLNGAIIKKCLITNATNKDWEDLTLDDERNLYIADVGNNLNNRRDLAILKVNMDLAFSNDSVIVEQIMFSYIDQNEFPPEKTNFKFNCESIYWKNDTIHLITKNEAKVLKQKRKKGTNAFPVSLCSRCPEDYVIPALPGEYLAKRNTEQLQYVKSVHHRGIKDLVTSIDYKNKMLVVLTYSHMYTKYLDDQKYPKEIHSFTFKKISQKEAVVILSKKKVAVAAERNWFLGGPFLYIITFE